MHPINTLSDLKSACDVDESGCWHIHPEYLRSATAKKRFTLWSPSLHQYMTITRLAWHLDHPGESLPTQVKTFHKCASADCANPAHVQTDRPAPKPSAKKGLPPNSIFQMADRCVSNQSERTSA